MTTLAISGTFVDHIGHNATFGLSAAGEGNSLSGEMVFSNFGGPGQFTISDMKGTGTWDGTGWNFTLSGRLETAGNHYEPGSGTLRLYEANGRPQAAINVSNTAGSYSVDTGALPAEQSQLKGTVNKPQGPAAG